jgi:hypothetical protein
MQPTFSTPSSLVFVFVVLFIKTLENVHLLGVDKDPLGDQ